jgi:tetratricopeptide (TPR) repeat protein
LERVPVADGEAVVGNHGERAGAVPRLSLPFRDAAAPGAADATVQTGMLNKSATKRKLTRKEQRDLDLEIAVMEGLVQRDGAYAEAWRVLSEDYSRRSRFQDGLRADEHLAKIQPECPDVLYNLACSYSLTRNIERAVEVLTRAIGRGFDDFKWMLRDPDLVHLRKDPIFKKVWVTISALQAGVH